MCLKSFRFVSFPEIVKMENKIPFSVKMESLQRTPMVTPPPLYLSSSSHDLVLPTPNLTSTFYTPGEGRIQINPLKKNNNNNNKIK